MHNYVCIGQKVSSHHRPELLALTRCARSTTDVLISQPCVLSELLRRPRADASDPQYHNPQLFTPLPLQPSAVSLAAASTQTCEALKLPAVTQSEELPRDAAAPRAVEAPLPTKSPSSLPAASAEKVRDSPLRRFRMAARLNMLMRRGVARWQQRSQSAAPVQA